jgi:hypothetical protein
MVCADNGIGMSASGTYVGDFFSFSFECAAEISLHHAHGRDTVRAERLNNL